MFYRFSSVIREKMICLNISERGVRTIHKAKVYTSFLRPEEGVRLIYRCVLYKRNYGIPIERWMKREGGEIGWRSRKQSEREREKEEEYTNRKIEEERGWREVGWRSRKESEREKGKKRRNIPIER